MKSITKRAKTSRPTPASKARLENEPGSMCQTRSTICKFGLICVISVCSLTILWNEGSKHVSDLTAGTVKYTRHLFEISNAHRFHRKTQVAMNKNTRFRGTMNWSDEDVQAFDERSKAANIRKFKSSYNIQTVNFFDLAQVHSFCSTLQFRRDFKWKMEGKNTTEILQWIAEHLDLTFVCGHIKNVGSQYYSKTQIRSCVKYLDNIPLDINSGDKVSGAKEMEVSTSNLIPVNMSHFCDSFIVFIGEELTNGGHSLFRPVRSIEESGSMEEFLTEFNFYENTLIITQITFPPLKRRMEAWARRLGFGGLLKVAAKNDLGNCYHYSGHTVTGPFCREFGCSLDTLVEDIGFSEGRCHGAITHTLTSSSMEVESEKLRKISPESINDDGTPNLRQYNDQLLWTMLQSVAVNLCAHPEVIKVHGDQLGECLHGVGHAVFDFELMQLRDPLTPSLEELMELTDVASNACWRLAFVNHNNTEYIVSKEGFKISRANLAFYCGTGVWHRLDNTIKGLSIPTKSHDLWYLIGSLKLLEMCSKTALTGSCYRYMFVHILDVRMMESELAAKDSDAALSENKVYPQLVEVARRKGNAIAEICGAIHKSKVLKAISLEQSFLEKQVYACCAMGFSTALDSYLRTSSDALHSNLYEILSAMKNATQGLLAGELSLDNPRDLLYVHVHTRAKYFWHYTELYCKSTLFSRSFQKECLRWLHNGYYGIQVDWTWGTVSPNEVGAPSLPSS